MLYGASPLSFFACEVDPQCFRMTKEAMVKQFAKAAHDASNDTKISGEVAGATARMASLVREGATADPL